MSIGFLFPGQGAQSPQMLQPIRSYGIDVSEVFQEVSEGCGFDVEKLIETSNKELLSKTQYTQIVMYACDMAYYKILKELGVSPDWVAGHSLGQYAALTASGVLDLFEAGCLIKQRSMLMDKVTREGKLCAISSPALEIDILDKLCKEIEKEIHKCIRIALYNSNRQVVVGGEPDAITEFAERASELENYKIKILPVGQAFHTPIMDEMIEEFQEHVNKLNLHKPNIPIILNCTGEFLNVEHYDTAVREEMLKQCNQPVQWVKTMQLMIEEKTQSVMEAGPGHSLCGLLKNMTKDIKSYHMDERRTVMKFLKEYRSV